MRLEGKHGGWPLGRAGPVHRLPQDLPVTPMHSIEIADRNNRADQSVETGSFIAHDNEWVGGCWFGHGGRYGDIAPCRVKRRLVKAVSREAF
jgi:hypothetical protein